MMKRALIVFSLLLSACGGDAPEHYLKIQNAGLALDHAQTQMTITLVAKQISPLPEGGKLVAQFEYGEEQRREDVLPVVVGQLTYKFEFREEAGENKFAAVRATLFAYDAAGKEIDKLEKDFGSPIDKHEVPRVSDMVPDRERQVEQLNDEGF